MKRLFLDVTHSAGTNTSHGIQRCTRNLAQQAIRYSAAHDLPCIPVVLFDGKFYPATEACIERGFRKTSVDSLNWQKSLSRWLTPPGQLGRANLSKKLHKLFYPRTLARTLSQIKFRRECNQPACRFDSGDVLLLADAWWDTPIVDHLPAIRQSGTKIGTLLQDLIPLRYPELSEANFARHFRNWLPRALTTLDFVLTNSETTRRDIVLFLRQANIPIPDSHVQAIRLGCDLPEQENADQNRISPKVQSRFQSKSTSPYLMVSTLEVRKNHAYLVDAFDQLWDAGHNVSLCLVGRPGWKCDELMQRLTNHTEYGRRLIVFTDLDDNELRFAYQNAKAFLFSSKAEGFGLPIVEALYSRLNVFASNIPIHREVGGQHCRYFALDSPTSLFKQIVQFERTRGWNSPPDARPWSHPWSATFEQIVRQCSQLASHGSHSTKAA